MSNPLDHLAGDTPGLRTALENLINEAQAAARQLNRLGEPAPASLGMAIEQARRALKQAQTE